MNEEHLLRLEYPRILEQLAEHTSFSASRHLALSLRPSSDEAEVRRRLRETGEAKDLLARRAEITVGAAHDVRAVAHHASLEAMLQPAELLDVLATLQSARKLRYAILALKENYPLLAGYAEQIDPLPTVADAIARCLDADGQVLDSASPALARIRQQAAAARQRLLDRLHNLINSSENVRFLQEQIVTERAGRFVVPLKVEFRGRIPGIVHDQSSSGATLFIEPLATVDLNNQWHELLLAEKREVERILAELSHMVGAEAEAICLDVDMLGQLDLAFAKARYSYALRGTEVDVCAGRWPPRCHDGSLPSLAHPLHLVKARHPLLAPKTVVPIDVYLGADVTVLLITGPNTGGKTVTLKTVGLLAAMSQAGLHIPAGEGSRLPVFSGIYADIGDEQSIEQSLSTFSSHLSHIVDILRLADSSSLVLLDELGAGTDPVEGAALAQAIIDELLDRRCLALCTSHYSQLKIYAFGTPGVQNASVDFDVDTLSPTYRLIIGLPGRSNAFAIAERLGLSPDILERARSLVTPESSRTDALLDKVRTARDAAEEARVDLERRRERVRELEDSLRRKLAGIEETRRQVIEQAREEGRRELEYLRFEIRRLQARLAAQPAASEAVKEVVAVIDKLAESVAPLEPAEQVRAPSKEPLAVGDTVYITTLDQKGQLLSLSPNEAEVAVGGFRLRLHPAKIEFRSHAAGPTELPATPVLRPRPPSPGMELDLRGMRAEEVGPVLNKYLDDAYLAALPWVHIIHGKGTGVLKDVVRGMLPHHPLVASYRPGELSEGGDGITVVKLERPEN